MTKLRKENFKIESLCFKETSYANPKYEIIYTCTPEYGTIICLSSDVPDERKINNTVNSIDFDRKIYNLIKNWKHNYKPKVEIFDDLDWELDIVLQDGTKCHYKGYYETPENFEHFERFLQYTINKQQDYYKWEYSEFTTKTDLQAYIDKIKPVLIGESINHIFVNPDIVTGGSFIQGYDLLKDNEGVSIDLIYPPCIFKIGDHTFIFDMYGGSDLHVSLDKEFEIIDKEEFVYYEISALFSKNIIRQKIKDITIKPISKYDAQASIDWYPSEVYSDDMFERIVFELENGSSLIIREVFDNTGIIEGVI